MCFGIGCVVLASKQNHYYMIQANELRIGNWLIDIKFGSYIRFKSFFGLCNVEANPDLYNPIPLTPEILEKAGFELRKEYGTSIEIDYKLYPLYVKFEHNGGLLITIHEYSSCSHVKYLHQLQNLYFALTGEELQIDL